MQSIVATDAVKETFAGAKSLVEVRDSAGVVIGFFAPVALEHAARYAEAAAAIDPLASKRQTKSGLTMTTPEVLNFLQTLESR